MGIQGNNDFGKDNSGVGLTAVNTARKGTMIRYTEENKAEVVAYAEKHGVMAASKKFKVCDPTIYLWKKKAKEAKTTTFKESTGNADIGDPKNWSNGIPGPEDHAILANASVISSPEVGYLRRMLALREQEIAILRERLGENGKVP